MTRPQALQSDGIVVGTQSTRPAVRGVYILIEAAEQGSDILASIIFDQIGVESAYVVTAVQIEYEVAADNSLVERFARGIQRQACF